MEIKIEKFCLLKTAQTLIEETIDKINKKIQADN